MIEFRRFDHIGACEIRDTVQDVYARSYAEAIATGDPFESLEASMNRFDTYLRAPGFDLVVLYLDGEPIGQAWGWPLGKNTAGWEGLQLDEDDPKFTCEDGTRTFGFAEIMVVPERTGQGNARALHDELLKARPEQRATLLVDPRNERAYERYRQWGWYKVGVQRPAWEGAPTFDVLIRGLPI